jgi:Secretin and TonB N terminus short domain
MRWCIAATVICMSIATVAVADDVHAWIKKPTNIPPQGLAPALQILAKDRNFQIIYVSEEISGRRTQGAVGELTPEEAIKQLLEGTGLTFKYLDDKTITIVPASPAASRSPPEVSEASQAAARAASSTAQGAQPEAAIEPSKLPQVTIDAQREALEHRVSHFVTALTEQADSYESLARWHNKVCPLVAGLPRDRGDFVLERISTIAQSAGVPVGPRDCAPNFFVLFTPDPKKLLKNGRTARRSSNLSSTRGRYGSGTTPSSRELWAINCALLTRQAREGIHLCKTTIL